MCVCVSLTDNNHRHKFSSDGFFIRMVQFYCREEIQERLIISQTMTVSLYISTDL